MPDVLQMPPFNAEAERGIVAAALIDNACLDEVSHLLAKSDFRIPDLGEAFGAMVRLRREGKPLDIAIVVSELQKVRADEDGWSQLLANALETTPHAGHLKYHAQLIRDTADQRQLIYKLGESIDQLYQHTPAADVCRSIENIIDLQVSRRLSSATRSAAFVLSDVLAELDKPESPGIVSGFPTLDNLTGGFKPGQLIVIAARPGVGKTAFVTGLARRLAEDQQSVLIHSAEMEAGELMQRLLAAESGIGLRQLHSQFQTAGGRQLIGDAAEYLASLPLHIDDAPGRTISDIEALSRLHKRQHGLSCVIIDYLGLVSPDNPKATQEQQIAQISRGCKMAAKALQIPVIALAQLNRAIEHRDDRRPKLSDLRSSGAIEQDADVVLFLDRPRMWNASASEDEAMLVVGKNRHGMTADIPLQWDGLAMRFSERPFHDPTVPDDVFEDDELSTGGDYR